MPSATWFALLCGLAAGVMGIEPSRGNWTVDNCIVVKMAGKLSINTSQNKTQKVEVDIPVTAKAHGECKNENQTMTLSWEVPEQDKNLSLTRNLTVLFARNDSTSPPVYGLKKLEGVYEIRHFEKNVTNGNKTENQTVVQYVSFTTFSLEKLEFQTPVNRSYLCLDVGTISMHAELHESPEKGGAAGEKLNNSNFTARNVEFDAFRPVDIAPDAMQTALDCSFRPSDVVPIVVGCALAGTVLLVLVAYLVGRRRNRARGYQSV